MYNYRQAIKADVLKWIEDNEYEPSASDTPREVMEDLCDTLYNLDEITGNTDWYDSELQCSKYLAGNFDIVYDALEEFGTTGETVARYYAEQSIARFFDCTIRCYLLYDIIHEIIVERMGSDE